MLNDKYSNLPAQAGLLAYVRTLQEKTHAIGMLEALEGEVFDKDFANFKKALSAKVESWLAEIITDQFPSSCTTAGEACRDDVQKIIENLTDALNSLTVVKITLAFRPTEKFINTLVTSLRKDFGDRIVLDISYDPAIIGGAVIEYKGKYIDNSIKHAI